MGFNPKYAQWRTENWRGYAPTIGDMADKHWNLTARCWTCSLEMAVDARRVIQATGADVEPLGQERALPPPRLFRPDEAQSLCAWTRLLGRHLESEDTLQALSRA